MKKNRSIFQLLILLLFTSIIIQSCSQPLSGQLYYQQQSEEESETEAEIDWGTENEDENEEDDEDEEDYDDDDYGEEEGGSENDNGSSGVIIKSISVFSIILPNGEIDEEILSENQEDLIELKGKLAVTESFSSTELGNKLIRSKFTSDNVPVLWYDTGVWNPGYSEKNEFKNNGPDTKAGSNRISNVVYYKYSKLNPFYSAGASHNTLKYSSDTDETRINRFVFYRFTGDTASPSLDNMLVAVDTYTRLFFCFGKPTDYKTVWGQDVPTKWGAVDKESTDSDGKKHKFYEYDPAGYIDNDGKFITESWYETNLAAGNYDPQYTGKSPYTLRIKILIPVPEGEDGDEGDNGEDEGDQEEIIPSITASGIEDGILKDDDSGYFYTSIEIKKQKSEVRYIIYRLDDRSEDWTEICSTSVPAEETYSYKDYNALILTTLPKYKTEAYNFDDDLINESEIVEGSRMLTNREMLLGAMEEIRISFSKLWYKTGSVSGNISKGSINASEGVFFHGIDRNGFFGTNYRRYQKYNNYSNSLFVLNGTFMKDNGGGATWDHRQGTWTHNGSNWPDDNDFKPRTDSLTIDFGSSSCEIEFNGIKIDNNDENDPDWKSGSFKVISDSGTEEFDKTSGLPFALFMDKSTFLDKIDAENYKQQ